MKTTDLTASIRRRILLLLLTCVALGAVPSSGAPKSHSVIDTLRYSVTDARGVTSEKEALVYLPAGYDSDDRSRRYNVLYLAHGGGDNPGSFFSPDRTAEPLDKVADRLVDEGLMDPIIIVSASYYPAGPAAADMARSVDFCREFHKELRRSLIPAVGARYNTYLRGGDDASITATRAHRAYGGFSLGALSTWYQMAEDLDAVSRFVPLSGDLWVFDDEGNRRGAPEAASWLADKVRLTPYRGNDFKIIARTGDKDIACVPESGLVEALTADTTLFSRSEAPFSGNLSFAVSPGGVHDYNYVSRYLAEAMPLLWEKTHRDDFVLGADISGTTMMEAHGAQFRNARGEVRENTALMKELGMNLARLRVWVNPQGGFCGKEDVLAMARRAKENGLKIMIDFHYSDSWADPGKQPVPEEWKGYSLAKMKKAVADHTAGTLRLLRDNGIDVGWIQLGNETTHGMLWDMGRAETSMENYAALTDAAYAAAKKIYPEAVCIVHLDAGADISRYHRIFDGLEKHGARYDMIGMSVYPYWDMKAGITRSEQETIDKVMENIKALKERYGKDLMIVETGYEASRPNEGYAFMRKLINSAMEADECKGVVYWAPELEGAYPLGAFENGRPTHILDAFTEASRGMAPADTTFFSTSELHCRSVNGEIFGRLYLPYSSPYASDGKIPVMVMAHGFNGTHQETRGFAETMARNGVAAYIFDFCGGSMASRSEGNTADMSVHTEEADLEAVVAALCRLPNIDSRRVSLLGCSQGALVSTITAADNPGMFNAVALIYPALGIPETAPFMLERTRDTPCDFEFWGMKMSQKYYRSILGLAPFAYLERISAPLLVVYGDEDAITPSETMERVSSLPSGPAMRKIEGGKHGFPDPFNHRLAETYVMSFIREVLEK